jgi:hypothetical protein
VGEFLKVALARLERAVAQGEAQRTGAPAGGFLVRPNTRIEEAANAG